ncbi:uncharacterized protein LOC126691393 [Quercus robur]|uniref:uncharacterized protein LOC126691393 n=1 Tax=Quercus robur TaxID=38942 RepID=UPI0021623B0D|nr:uncharacterized protein LOC126691393 [Quercus robur]
MARINGIQRALSVRPSTFLVNLENELLKDLDNVLSQEEELWALKSRVNWMIQGDRNTTFYHVSTLVRRKRNQILAIKDSMGEWVLEESDVKTVVRSGFNGIYTSSFDSASRAAPVISQWQASLSNEDRESIGGAASVEEIKAALWSLKAFKAPGPDGLHAGFFHRFWLIVGDSVIDVVKKVFAERAVPEYLNRTLIALIPKIQSPKTLNNYRPISLCNTVYKIITKIIVARLRPYLDKLISPLQTAFVPGRKGIDNVIIVQEIIHTLSRKKGNVGYMTIKIDLEKAYDKLEWSFIRDMLIRANIPADLIDIIMSCISTVSTSILFNGEALDPIYPTRGIRKGDPLSPYLFILCMEFLGHLIEEKCTAKVWQPVKASCGGPAFSHLFFADDLVLFAKADHINCSAVRDVIDEFCSASGQSVSAAKSRVYFSPNVDRDSRESFCDILGFASTPSLGKYLGIPIKHPGSSPQEFNFILDRVKNKLAGWKANLLSLAGRAVLIQASSAAIPAYVMQCTHIPNKVLEGVDRSAKGRNTALLAKLNWRLHVEKEALWAQVLRKKYCNQRRTSSANADRLPCSQIWKAVKIGRSTFNEGSMWTVGRDSNLSFWWDNWTGKGPLRCMIQGPLTQGANQWKVCDLLADFSWDWGRIPFDLPAKVKAIIQAIPIPIASRGQDRLAWAGNPRGTFDLRSAYSIATADVDTPLFSSGWIWKLETLPKIKTFLWMCHHNSIGVRSCLAKRGVTIEDLCPICKRVPESIIHATRDCEWVKGIWMQLGVSASNRDFWMSNLQDWINLNGRTNCSRAQEKPPWKITFSFAMWCLWKNRNMVVFHGKRVNQNLPKEIMDQVLEFIYCVQSPRSPNHKISRNLRWERPPTGWKKLNTDGSRLGGSDRAGCGGLVRDEHGEWVAGFTRHIGSTSSFIAELWGLREGLLLCCNLNIESLMVELDAQAVVDVLKNNAYENNVVSPILDDCRLLAARFHQIQFKHCYRQVNRCADLLAKMGAAQELDFISFVSPPVDICNAFEDDLNGVYCNRMCSVTAGCKGTLIAYIRNLKLADSSGRYWALQQRSAINSLIADESLKSVPLCVALLASVFKCKNELKLRVQEHFASVLETFQTRFSVNFDSGFVSG